VSDLGIAESTDIVGGLAPQRPRRVTTVTRIVAPAQIRLSRTHRTRWRRLEYRTRPRAAFRTSLPGRALHALTDHALADLERVSIRRSDTTNGTPTTYTFHKSPRTPRKFFPIRYQRRRRRTPAAPPPTPRLTRSSFRQDTHSHTGDRVAGSRFD